MAFASRASWRLYSTVIPGREANPESRHSGSGPEPVIGRRKSADPLGPSRNDQERKKPAVICDGRLFRRAASFAAVTDATLTEPDGVERRSNALGRSEDLGRHAAYAGAGQADFAGCGSRQIEHPAMDEGAAVVDGDDDAAAAVGHPELGAERQGAVSRG